MCGAASNVEFRVCPSYAVSGGWCYSSDLVRMGKPGDSRLDQYSERSWQQKDFLVQDRRRNLEHLYHLTAACKSACKEAMLFRGFHCEMFIRDGELNSDNLKVTQKTRNDAAYEATTMLLDSIVRVRLLAEVFKRAAPDQDSLEVLRDITPLLALGASSSSQSAGQISRLNWHTPLAQEAIFEEIEQLHKGIKHYVDIGRQDLNTPEDVLLMFLKGSRPLPQCVATLDGDVNGASQTESATQCQALAWTDDGVPLCTIHRCHLPIGPTKLRCKNVVQTLSTKNTFILCNDHSCMLEGCKRPRANIDPSGNTKELLCNIHACFKCLELEAAPAAPAEDEAPRNVCVNHPICWEQGCTRLSVEQSAYCEDHQTIQCQYMISKKKKTKAVSTDGRYSRRAVL